MLSNKDDNARWEDQFYKDLDSIREGTCLYLSNDFKAAEALFRKGMLYGTVIDDEAEVKKDDASSEDATDKIDLRGAFGLQFAIVGLLRGVASMEDDQLDECLSRLWEADALVAKDKAWVGRKVCRGTCYLVAGIVECLRKQPIQGVLHMATSWMWLRSLKTEALDYDGVGKEIVRSAALLALGGFALIVSLLPDSLIKAASWTTGFEVKRSAGLDMLATCQREGGIYAPIAALGWISFSVDTKSFLGELQSDEELAECERLFHWAEPQFPNSLFFSILEADLYAKRRELAKAISIVERSMKLKCLDELKALKAMLLYKKAIYRLAALEFREAAVAFEVSQQIYKAAGRRSLGPSMAMGAAKCYIISGVGVGDSMQDAKRMMEEVATYKEMDKSNWVGSDRRAFQEYEEYASRFGGDSNNGNEKASWCLLRLATAMTIVMRCTLWMSADQASNFEETLCKSYDENNLDDVALASMCIALMCSHQNLTQKGLDYCEKGLSLSSQLSEMSDKFGTIPMLHYLVAHFHVENEDIHLAKNALSIAEELTKKEMVLHHYLSFKTSQLKRRIKDIIEGTYEVLNIPAGKKAVLKIELDSIPESISKPIYWDWFLQDRDIDFDASFCPKNSYGSEIAPTSRRSAEDGPVQGTFDVPSDCKNGGVLQLTFSNSYSYLRGKVVTYKLKLPPKAVCSTTMSS
mmetsp:Transcript_10802/g.16587  ORF Transcript_10802/g.16587 Transcript_10802/m.16587 type:complete len:692 (+) Transcript_10802:183-2258(+)|eukprot:CAMPEP_0178929110 /NCGR_PEP_ID=MMETSP0786-20121207/20349_1 /TAXON_ID=186022 /ORGANISM="Thalassionema frauenfeldii, Strain CCMP 1798" /LENGTH=691 /DNA_ID=CAMNT_0020605193 /DNA_START=126 /DNA_END=2201 /DNA_ORIENTATION=-